MEDLSFNELGGSERKILSVFERHGHDGRAITIESLAVHTGLSTASPEFARAVTGLLAHGAIKRAGGDPIPGAPVAFRLTGDLPPPSTKAADLRPGGRRANPANESKREDQCAASSASERDVQMTEDF